MRQREQSPADVASLRVVTVPASSAQVLGIKTEFKNRRSFQKKICNGLQGKDKRMGEVVVSMHTLSRVDGRKICCIGSHPWKADVLPTPILRRHLHTHAQATSRAPLSWRVPGVRLIDDESCRGLGLKGGFLVGCHRVPRRERVWHVGNERHREGCQWAW